MYKVVGGEYKTTKFDQLASEFEQYGPFETYDSALKKWRALTGRTVDNCLIRYQIHEVKEN